MKSAIARRGSRVDASLVGAASLDPGATNVRTDATFAYVTPERATRG